MSHLLLLLAKFKSGDRKGAEESLRKAKLLAAAFDAAPNHAANRVKHVRESEMTNAHDLLGETAMDAVTFVLHDKDPELQKFWAEVCSHEQMERHRIQMEYRNDLQDQRVSERKTNPHSDAL